MSESGRAQASTPVAALTSSQPSARRRDGRPTRLPGPSMAREVSWPLCWPTRRALPLRISSTRLGTIALLLRLWPMLKRTMLPSSLSRWSVASSSSREAGEAIELSGNGHLGAIPTSQIRPWILHRTFSGSTPGTAPEPSSAPCPHRSALPRSAPTGLSATSLQCGTVPTVGPVGLCAAVRSGRMGLI